MNFDVLTGPRLKLRNFGPEDVTPEYINWLNDPRVVRFSNQRFRNHDRASCEAYLATFDGTDNLFISIREVSTDHALGTMTAYVNQNHRTADVGIMIGESAVWGSGIGLEAWCLLTDWLLSEGGIRKVTAGTLACNAGMIRLAERSGMSLEGRRIAQELVDGQPYDMLYFGRFAE